MTISAMFSYNNNSGGAKELSAATGINRLRHRGSTFVPKATKKILNWGAASMPEELLVCNILNHPNRVAVAVNKLSAFQAMQEGNVSIPEFTTDRAAAVRWLEQGKFVFARQQLRAHSGNGIAIMDPEHPDTWEVRAPLYVLYVPKKHEYRIHVAGGRVIDTQRKGLRAEFRGAEDVNHKVRNLANGFVYVRNDGHEVPAPVLEQAIGAVAALNLDFGAVDVVYNQQQRRAYVLEVNTAPGLAGATVASYAEYFRGI